MRTAKKQEKLKPKTGYWRREAIVVRRDAGKWRGGWKGVRGGREEGRCGSLISTLYGHDVRTTV